MSFGSRIKRQARRVTQDQEVPEQEPVALQRISRKNSPTAKSYQALRETAYPNTACRQNCHVFDTDLNEIHDDYEDRLIDFHTAESRASQLGSVVCAGNLETADAPKESVDLSFVRMAGQCAALINNYKDY